MNIFKKKAILSLDDDKLDTAVKIQGTKFDRKRRFTEKDVKKMSKMYEKGIPMKVIEETFGTSKIAILYNIDEEFRLNYNANRSGKHTGSTTCDKQNRVEYKRSLVKSNKKVIINV